ncbi:MAG TPA: D-arabinono-1,4-lactone oxidase [Rhizomicrobium sp.]|jgi:FAD-linked oxidoreductase|nr:D-arabinono-1,4-lactone oxidase [Rhizomicrobium sp.]
MKLVNGKWSNWSGGVKCRPKTVAAPGNEIDLAGAIRTAEDPVRAAGSGHSFTPLCASDGVLLDLAAFSGLKTVSLDPPAATFLAATPLWATGPALYAKGLALNNMGDIDRQMLGGVVATGTHGTGRTLGSFSSDVAGFRIVLASGAVLNCSPRENSEIFLAGRVALGMLGVMAEITMSVRPRYRLVEDDFFLARDELFARLDELVAKNRHFEFFWFPYSEIAVCKALNETEKSAPEPRSAEELRQHGLRYDSGSRVFAGINEVLPYMPFLLKPAHGLFSRFMPTPARARWSHETFPSPRPVRFNEMEYAVPVARGADCVKEIVAEIRRKRINTGFPIEFRTVAADDIWLSPFYRRDSATIAVHQYYKVDTGPLFNACEAIFRNYEGRPHWGKRHSRSREELVRLYPAFERFCSLRRELDPTGKFLNGYLRGLFE